MPSAQFGLILLSLVLAGGIVFAAERFSAPQGQVEIRSAAQSAAALPTNTNWEATLYAIQAKTGTSTAPAAPSQESVAKIIASVTSPNVTDTISRSLLINLTNAKTQGLGDDIPTQDKLVADAVAQIKATAPSGYTVADLNLVAATPATLRAYGNAVITVVASQPNANERGTLIAFGYASDTGKKDSLAALASAGAAYGAIARELLATQVPQTLVPLHLAIVNNFGRIASSYTDMQTILTDPLRGLAGLQTYESLLGEESRLFTNVAEALQKSGIIFSKDEPGNAWSAFLSSYGQ